MKSLKEFKPLIKLIKEDKRTEVEYMTLLERDERNRETGICLVAGADLL